MRFTTLPSFWLTFALATSALAEPVRLYVAPNGNDAWSGRLDAPVSAVQDGPKATVQAALAAGRALKAQHQAVDGVTVVVRGGAYRLAEPLRIGPDDSGFDAARPTTIEAFRGEKPVLSGGRELSGWRRVEGHEDRWQTEIPEVREGKWYFRELFINGERRQRARTPNEGFFRIQGPSSQDKPVKLKFRPGDIKKEWAADGDVEVVALLAWADFRMQIRAVDDEAHVATLSGDPRPSNRENDARYFIENAPGSADAAGEWILDRKSGVLTYQGKPGEDLTQEEVVAPRLTGLILIEGDLSAKRPVHDLVLRGLTFSHTDWTLGEHGYADTQAAIAWPGDVRLEGARDCVIEDCTFAHLAGYALELGRGCQRNRVVGNEMVDLGAGGIRIGETEKRPERFESNFGQVVTDNEIHHLGRVFPPAVGVLILQSSHNRVAHNNIYDLYYTAVSVGWNWGYQETPCHDNVIEFNQLYDVGQFMLSDMGAVYTLGIQKGTVIRNNLIHDVNSFTYGGWGLYTDEGSSDIILENNVVYRTKSAGFHQHYGRENIVRNNIFAFGREHQLMRTREESHLSFMFFNNIIYFDSGDLLGSNWRNDHYLMDFNLFFDARPGATPESLRFSGATLDEWRRRGHDVHSVVVDPRFKAPEKADFRLAADSPALKVGFTPIDLTSVGVRPKGARN